MNIIKFGSDTKHRKQWFTGLSFSHPAKMTLPLQIWLIENFTKEGETILDPMAGSGTILVACSLGRHVVAVELEQKFVDMMKGNWQKIQERGCQMGYSTGKAIILQGDARNLKGILADKCIFSPPYAEGKQFADATFEKQMRIDTKRLGAILKHNPENPNNIGNLPYGQMDSLCSPQVDKIISSPPYEGSVNVPDSKPEARAERLKEAGYDPKDYQGGTGRNLQQNWSYHPRVDAVISSPPYEGSIAGNGIGCDGKDPEVSRLPREYSKSDNNIGNLKADSYLSAMLLVYRQCYAVLRPGGLMILVIKNFLRNRKEVFLDADTIALCEKSGFSFVDRYYRRLTQQSFWRTIYAQRYPTAPRIEFEHILIFKKGDVP